ncbi:hypothetical protein BH11PLA2_BH11PLA2_48530 [soil metagenome]
MKSPLKIYLVLGLLFAVIFGVTVIASLTPTVPPKPDGPLGGDTAESIIPLTGEIHDYHFDPKSEDDYHNRLFAGFLEVGTGGSDNVPRNWIAFVMQNRRGQPVKLSPVYRSCSKCTSARIAILPEDAVKNFAAITAAGSLFNLQGMPNPLAAVAWAHIYSKLEWQQFDFANPKQMITVPPAPNGVTPTWVILELDFKIAVKAAPDKVSAAFDLYDAAGVKLLPQPSMFSVTYAAREAFETWPENIAVGELPEGSGPREFDVYAFSMTRDKIPPPFSTASGDMVTLGTPVPLSGEECAQLASRVGVELKGPVRVRSGYRIPVTVRRQGAGGQTPEVGEFESTVELANQSLTQAAFRTTLKGTITGAVRIDGASKFELGSYASQFATKKEFKLISDRTDLELELVADRSEPKFVKLDLSKPETAFGRRTWTLTATIAEQQGRSPPWNGHVVLRTTGSNPVTFRFPMTGHGR